MSNLILDTDSYKASHFNQYPPGTESMFSYFESRGGDYKELVFFGLQYILKKYLTIPITQDDVEQARIFFKAHGLPFNYKGWTYIVNHHEGYIPVRIRAVPEGMRIPVNNVMMTVESTDPEVFWVVNWLETMLVRLWYPITVATRSAKIREVIYEYLEKTSDNPDEEILFKLHDFGSRGVSSRESAEIGATAHLINFRGSDTVTGIVAANEYYNSGMSGFSIPAMEHSTVTSWGQDNELDSYKNMLDKYAKTYPMLACVSDSYNLSSAIDLFWGVELKQQVLDSKSTIIIRPDSGEDIVGILLDTLNSLESHYGSKTNSKNYSVLNNVKVIQGDGITEHTISNILEELTSSGWATTNIAFGMGGGLLQQLNRDTAQFAYKCSSVTVDGQMNDVFKDPITDPKKKSKGGRLDLILDSKTNKLETVRIYWGMNYVTGTVMRTVFENGKLLIDDDLETIRDRTWPTVSG